MTAGRHSLQNSRDRFRQQTDMNTQTPKAAGSNVLRSADHTYSTMSTSTVDVESNRAPAIPTWHGPTITSGGLPHDDKLCAGHGARPVTEDDTAGKEACFSPTQTHDRDIPEQLVCLIVRMIPGLEGRELAEAYRDGTDLPPITSQSLSELGIQNIITNIKLRHDVNFDRDLSFRPNLDGAKGHEKVRAAQKYWKALVAELELYNLLFHGTASRRELEGINWTAVTQHAERRIPIMFQTIQDVLKSLVPDRDHSRVDEHLDVSMLMQEIERGVCDLVRLAEWMAYLLKEHCAPMRDGWVDKMVTYTRLGVATNSPGDIVKGLRELLGILEAMKLDVANHQIRNLKALLIEDTINFEKHYHLDRLVNGRARVNINTAHGWYLLAANPFGQQPLTTCHDPLRLQLEDFVRAVVTTLFSRDGRFEFPETFYLDYDRLRILKAEIEDVVSFDICFEMFANLIKQFGYEGTVLPATRQQLRVSLSAIMGEGSGYGSYAWTMNSEALSLEVLRQASLFAGRLPTHNLDSIMQAEQHLRHVFHTTFGTHATRFEAALLKQVLACTERHINSSPTELFNTLVPASSSAPLPPLQSSHSVANPDTFAFLLPATTNNKMTDLTHRITHVILLHWRTWRRIAYIRDEETKQPTTDVVEGGLETLPLTSLTKPAAGEAAVTATVDSHPQSSIMREDGKQ